MARLSELCPLTRAPRGALGPGGSKPARGRGRTIGRSGRTGGARRSLPPRPPRRGPEARPSVTRRPPRSCHRLRRGDPVPRARPLGLGSDSGTPGWGQRGAVFFARAGRVRGPAAARRPGGATPGAERGRDIPQGPPRRNRDGTRGAPAPPTTPAPGETPKGTGSPGAAPGPPPRRDERPAGVPRREGRAGGRPTAGRGEPDPRRSRPDRAYLQVVLRKILAQPRYLHVLVQVQGRHFRKNWPRRRRRRRWRRR